jgi:hypothetical protein
MFLTIYNEDAAEGTASFSPMNEDISMANLINIMQDPDTLAPTYRRRATASDNKLRFICHSANPPAAAIPFVLVFENDFAAISSTTEIAFVSTTVGIKEQVTVQLIPKNQRPSRPQGYKYTVVMDGRTWDPRVVPN